MVMWSGVVVVLMLPEIEQESRRTEYAVEPEAPPMPEPVGEDWEERMEAWNREHTVIVPAPRWDLIALDFFFLLVVIPAAVILSVALAGATIYYVGWWVVRGFRAG
jgi:hypothetical protein